MADMTVIFNPQNPKIKREILQMIIQYLSDEGLHSSMFTLSDEANVWIHQQISKTAQIKRMRDALLDGDWALVEKLATKSTFRGEKSFLYAVYKQQYLELVDQQEYQNAFELLTTKLKPLEHHQSYQLEFRDLCYLLTCKTSQSFSDSGSGSGGGNINRPEDVGSARESLVQHYQDLLTSEALDNITRVEAPTPAHRLVTLLQQAANYQILNTRQHRQPQQPQQPPQPQQQQHTAKIESLLTDYQIPLPPNRLCSISLGHTRNVKCVTFAGRNDDLVVSGSSDNTVRLWRASTGKCLDVLVGHTSRVWSLATDKSGGFGNSSSGGGGGGGGGLIASASGDGTVRLWRLPDDPYDADDDMGDLSGTTASSSQSDTATTTAATAAAGKTKCVRTIENPSGSDVYSVAFSPRGTHVALASADSTVKLYDVRTGSLVRTFCGHSGSVSSVVFNMYGNLLASAGKDSVIRFWDILSGVCVNTYKTQRTFEVTGLAMGDNGLDLLAACKDNSNRLWDLRSNNVVKRYKGYENTTKIFIRCCFGPANILVSGSEDGRVYQWDRTTGEIVQTLAQHTDTVYDVAWSKQKSLLVSCSGDCTLRSWRQDG